LQRKLLATARTASGHQCRFERSLGTSALTPIATEFRLCKKQRNGRLRLSPPQKK
jgi:hypothetical protein